MRNKKLLGLGLFLVIGIFLISIVSAQASYCCERLDNGAWCQNAPADECDADYRSAPTSCEATSYCKLGTCINTGEGTCMPNSPQKVCDENNGIWDGREKADIPQCQLGCCLIGDQAAFVTQTRCKSLSSLYGLEVNYRTDLGTEVECILSASADVKGACVFEQEFQRTCKMLSQQECTDLGASLETEFYEGYLCSAEELETNCGPRGGTTCVEGRDEVYFLDTCGNLANVYDYSRLNDNNDYWKFIQQPSCDDGNGNKDSSSCGNCDYFLGSTCKDAGRVSNPNYGNYICKNLDCEYDGEDYQHGETWCANSLGTEDNLAGSRSFRMVCYNNEVSVEPCADFRQEVCLQSDVNGFRAAACRVNMWQDCFSQDNPSDCENRDKRDCQWIEGMSVLRNEDGESLAVDQLGNTVEASCVPLNSPGFDFWKEGGDAESMCSMASTQCVVDYEASIGDLARDERGDVVPNPECYDVCRSTGRDKDECEEKCTAACVNEKGELDEEWQSNMQSLCRSIGDCGSKTNFVGADGFNNWDSMFVREDEEEEDEE